MSDIDDAIHKYYLDNPGNILNVGEWETSIRCEACDCAVPHGHWSLNCSSEYVRKSNMVKKSCPNCNAVNVDTYGSAFQEKNKVKAIPTYNITRRYITLRYGQSSFLGIKYRDKEKDEGFWEYLDGTLKSC